MEFGHSHAVILLVLSVYLVHNAVGMPRRAEIETVSIQQQQLGEVKDKQPVQVIQAVQIPDRVSCESESKDEDEEATEDPVCQEHCQPKGYTYGLCVRHVCTCV